ncbi:MAG: hypothetical protein SO150_09055 [Faecalicoccus sp.]|uniref:hypothetical protein n=1 Tax=Faecalicoccus sp. TaxID=1971758 RepID=UPI002A80CE90|nr:hypothetical protein [Faecalicoccus sp.]MCI6379592.1 hypothetical protein [Erysipelotrichaceae bacterium]MDY4870475.1 hypothetical protein [Faecalicoccus sp.]MDY5109730.1 hypothetical protein [Faecalicoccus sp.]
MNQLERMKEHLQRNPNDYQTAISYLKKNTSEILYNRKRKDIEMYKRIKLAKQILKENENGK